MADSNTEGESCWVCLSGPEDAPDKQLELACRCPRPVHRECLARWQLQQAGRREEHYCRFCEQAYPDWKDSLTPKELKPSTPIMAVSVRGRVHKLRVRPGPDGKDDFKRQVRALLGYDDSMEFDVIFECKTPHSGEKVQLHGFSAFDAATHCAAVSAAKRLKNKAHRTSSAAAAAGSSPGSIHSSGSSGGESMSRSSSAPPSTSSGSSTGGSSTSSTPSPSTSATGAAHSEMQHSRTRVGVPSHLMAEYRDVMQLASASSAQLGGQQQQQLAPGSPFPNTTVPEHLQAQYRQFVQQRHQHHIAKQRALRARAAAASQSRPGETFNTAEAAAAAAGRTSPAGPSSPGVRSAWVAPQHSRPSSSSGSTAADASALLTATGQAGSAQQPTQQLLGGTALTAAAAEIQLSCPLPIDPCSSGSSPAAAAAEEVWANCGALSEPLPVLPAILRSSSAPSAPLEAAGSAAALAAAARTSSSPEGLTAAAASSIGCLGRWGSGPAPPVASSLQQPGKRKQQRKLAEVASSWLKQLAARKAGRVRV